MKATLANAYTTAPATPLYCISCICHCLSYLCISKSLLLLSGYDLDALSTCNLRQTRRTVVPITRSTTSILAMNHAVTLSGNL
jgi:hypothetical protein